MKPVFIKLTHYNIYGNKSFFVNANEIKLVQAVYHKWENKVKYFAEIYRDKAVYVISKKDYEKIKQL